MFAWMTMSLVGCPTEGCVVFSTEDVALGLGEMETVELEIVNPRLQLFQLTLETSGPITAELRPGSLSDEAFVDITCGDVAGEGKVFVRRADSGELCVRSVDVQCGDVAPTEDPTDPTSDEPVPDTLPGLAYTTCDRDDDACLIGASSSCYAIVDGPLVSNRTEVSVAGDLLNADGYVWTYLYAEMGYYEPYGPACSLNRSEERYDRTLTHEARTWLADDDFTGPTEDQVSFVSHCLADEITTELAMETQVPGTSTDPLRSTGAQPSKENQVIVVLRGARVCGMEIGQL
ncbi:MAG: hypothetical protein KTR31_02400 [Myxococcales bacterium]|nr:hypothetical protein [Myxococcales bacterium]